MTFFASSYRFPLGSHGPRGHEWATRLSAPHVMKVLEDDDPVPSRGRGRTPQPASGSRGAGAAAVNTSTTVTSGSRRGAKPSGSSPSSSSSSSQSPSPPPPRSRAPGAVSSFGSPTSLSSESLDESLRSFGGDSPVHQPTGSRCGRQ